MANVTVSVTAASTVIHTPTNASMMDPQPITVYNAGAQTVYLTINTPATSAIGVPLVSTGFVNLIFVTVSDVLRGIVTAGTAEVRVMSMRQ